MVRDTRNIENLGFSLWQEAARLLVARAGEWREGATAHSCCSLYLPASFVLCILMCIWKPFLKTCSVEYLSSQQGDGFAI